MKILQRRVRRTKPTIVLLETGEWVEESDLEVSFTGEGPLDGLEAVIEDEES